MDQRLADLSVLPILSSAPFSSMYAGRYVFSPVS